MLLVNHSLATLAIGRPPDGAPLDRMIEGGRP
jgi:hypothetical protein